jgi:hypothetical protein
MKDLEKYSEDSVIVKKEVWNDIQTKLKELEYKSKSIDIEISCSFSENMRYSHHIGYITIHDHDKIVPECMKELKDRINFLCENYIKSHNNVCDIEELKKELSEIKSTRWYKWFYKK